MKINELMIGDKVAVRSNDGCDFKELAEEKNQLYKELAKIYNDGVRYGRNLLVQLNNGEIAPNEILKDVKPF